MLPPVAHSLLRCDQSAVWVFQIAHAARSGPSPKDALSTVGKMCPPWQGRQVGRGKSGISMKSRCASQIEAYGLRLACATSRIARCGPSG
jgi:hypothetical protein